MFSAESPLTVLSTLPSAAPLESRVESKASSNEALNTPTDMASVMAVEHQELVIIDAGVPHLDVLLADFEEQGTDAPKVIVLEAGQDSLLRLGEILEGEQELKVVHLISHGSNGALELGGQTVTVLDLLARAGEIAGWRTAFADGADLLLYGCDIAGNAEGRVFIDTLARLSGADVAASDDVTGASAKGGNWSLEYRRGQVQGEVAFSQQLQEDYIASFATYTVSNLDDSGAGSLRQAIIDSNLSGSNNVIQFSVASGTINLTSELPDITKTVFIDGTTASDYIDIPVLRLDGTNSSTNANGLSFTDGSDGSKVKGLMIINFDGSGIVIDGADSILIESNYIGTDGITELENVGDGVFISNSINNVIGGASAGNVISGNQDSGVFLSTGSGSNTIAGNSIGTNSAGDVAIGNGSSGVEVGNGSSNNSIGGDGLAGEGNYISGNEEHGVYIHGIGTDNNVVSGNRIGTNAAGSDPLENLKAGVRLESDAKGTIIGGNTAGDRNIISGNVADGIYLGSTDENVISGNYIGLDVSGTEAIANGDDGVEITGGSSNNTIGGTTAAERNIISGNRDDGVQINGSGTELNVVSGNYIGTNESGTAAVGNGSNAVHIRLSASSNTVGTDESGGGNLLSGNFKSGVLISGDTSSDNAILGNTIGLASDGSSTVDNRRYGVYVLDAPNTTIGGSTSSAERNVISGNRFSGISISGVNAIKTVVSGNYIGTDTAGTAAVANRLNGVEIIDGANANSIGLDISGGGNVISGNLLEGVSLSGPGVNDNVLYGNSIGTSANGDAALGNGANGIYINSGASANIIGGGADDQGNIVSANGQDGIYIKGDGSDGNVVLGNYIGTDEAGTADLGNTRHGIYVFDGPQNTLIGDSGSNEGNLISGNGGHGIVLDGNGTISTTANLIKANVIGLDSTGNGGLGNTLGGISIADGASANTVGGDRTAGEGNVISGHTDSVGITVDGVNSDANIIVGNLVGTDLTGGSPFANSTGILNQDAPNTVIGGTASGEGNAVSGNTGSGIVIDGPGSADIVIYGNLIGTTLAGTAALGNGGVGVQVSGSSTRVTIGGTGSASRNVIAASGSQGVHIDGSDDISLIGNHIGTGSNGIENLGNALDGVLLSNATNTLIGGTEVAASNRIINSGGAGISVTGGSASGNAFLGNVVVDNTLLGIDLGANGITPNDTSVQDVDSGPNGLQNAPDLSHVITDGTSSLEIAGTLDSEANADYRIEFFANTVGDPDGAGEAERYLGFVSSTSDSGGLASFSTTLASVVAEGEFITATATHETGLDDYGNSSEFSTNEVANGPNTSPVISQSPALSAAENQTAVDTINATDADADALTYSIQGGADASGFSISATSGELTFNSAPDFETYTDADNNGIYEVIVRVTDERGATDDQAFSVTVTDVDEPASVSGNFVGSVVEGNIGDAAETTSGSLSISDPDAGDTPNFADVESTAGDNAYGDFELISGTWTYTLNQSAVQDLDDKESVTDTITYTATDSSTQIITVTITGTDDASEISGTVTGTVVEGDEDDFPETTSGTIGISDVDGEDSPSFNDVGSTSR